MAEAGFPGQHMTTTTVTSSTTVQTNVRFDPMYVRTIPGILKVIQVFCSLVGYICVLCSDYKYGSKSTYFNVICMVAFWFTGILLGLYLFHIVEKFYKIPWLKIELLFTGTWTLLYLIAAILAATIKDNAHAAAAFFAFCATAAYALDALLKWRGVRAGGLAQGTRVVSKTTTAEAPAPVRQGY